LVITGLHLKRPGWRLVLLLPVTLTSLKPAGAKRNVIDYDHASVATHTEAEEIVAAAKDFFELVERCIAASHPRLIP
jgi:hypothetical protein